MFIMRLNQKGFSAVEILIVIVVITLIGFVGWRVYDSNQDTGEDTNTTQQENSEDTSTTATNDDDSTQTEQTETTQSDEEATKRKSFTAYETSLTIDELEGWEYMGIYDYPGEGSNEYQINISNETRDIQLSLQISTFETSLYEQDIFDTFTGFNGETYYITSSVDDKPGDTRYQQMGISACDNGHCVTEIDNTYNLNANITPIGTNTDFNGSLENLEEIKKLFSSIIIE